MGPKLKMFSLNNIKHKSIGSCAFPFIQYLRKSTTYATDEDDVQVVHCNTSGMLPPLGCLLLRICWTARPMTRWFHCHPSESQIKCQKWGVFVESMLLECSTGNFSALKQKPVLALPSLREVEDCKSQIKVVAEPVPDSNWCENKDMPHWQEQCS